MTRLPDYGGIPIVTSAMCPPDRIFVSNDFGDSLVMIIHPWYDLKRAEYRPPLWTRHMLGSIEAQRDRRLHPR